MNPQAILDQIGQDAQQAAQKLLEDAQKKAQQLLAASAQRIETAHDQTRAQAQADAAELEQRLVRMAELEDRKTLLGKKRAVLDEAFALAADKLRHMPTDELRAFLVKAAAKEATGNECVIVCENDTAFAQGDLIGELNQAMRMLGKPAQLCLSEQKRTDATGLVLSSGGAETSCTLEAMLAAIRLELETQVASVLFA